MALYIDSQTPGSQFQHVEEESISAAEQAIIDRVLTLSLHQAESKPLKKGNFLSLKYRKLIQNMKMTKSSQKCTVCYQQFCQGEIIKRLPCKHIFHRDCAKSWLKVDRNCPNCRFDLQQHFETLEKQGKLPENPTQCSKQTKSKQQQAEH